MRWRRVCTPVVVVLLLADCDQSSVVGTDLSPGADGHGLCGPGSTWCGGKCVDTRVDPKNCGACSNACKAGQTCAAGVCGVYKPTGSGKDGHYVASKDTVLKAGTYDYMSVTIKSGIKVSVTGSGPLVINSQGTVVIAGSLDLSGKEGKSNNATRVR